MEKKLIPIILIVLLVGLGGGYGLGYVIYQPQIQNLQSDLKQLNNELETISSEIANLNSTIVNLENKTWNYVVNFTLSPFSNSSAFFIQGEVWRIEWKLQTAWSGSNFYVWDDDGHVLDYVDISLLQRGNYSVSGIHYMPYGNGWYYLETLYTNDNVIDFTIESYH